jgi:hypothetical protein
MWKFRFRVTKAQKEKIFHFFMTGKHWRFYKHSLNYDPSLFEQGYILIAEFSNENEIIVEEIDGGSRSLYYRNDDFLGHFLRYRGHNYEFVRGI